MTTPTFEVKVVAFDLKSHRYHDLESGEPTDLKKLLAEGWAISGQSSTGQKVIYTLVKTKILLE